MVTDSHGEALADDESKGVRQVSEKDIENFQVFGGFWKPSSWVNDIFWLVIFCVK